MTTGVELLTVDTGPDGTLLVSWELSAAAVAVDVATGTVPEPTAHTRVLTVPAGETSARVGAVGAGRTFVSVTPHGGGRVAVATDRRVAFEGLTNFRDLGGYRSADGSVLRWGLVYRAEALHRLTPADLFTYDALGVRSVFDLRGEEERRERPDPVPSRPIVIAGRPSEGAPPSFADATDGEALLETVYLELLTYSAGQVGELLAALAAPGALPAVFHCHAGKDRTGVVAAVLLEVLGVPRTTVLDDYELTARYRLRSQQDATFERLIASGLAPEVAAGVLTTPRRAMAAALTFLDRTYGGAIGWVTGVAGLAPADLQALRACLLDPPG